MLRNNFASARWSPSAPVPRRAVAFIFALLCFSLTAAEAVTYQVGPTRQYTQITQVVGLLVAGDIVEVDGNATYNPVTFSRSGSASLPIVIRGIRVNGRRPIISGGTNTVNFQGSRYIRMEGFDITAGSERCVFIAAADVTLRDSVVHDCPKHGILGADNGTGNITLEFIEVYASGSQPPGENLKHPIYIATDSSMYPNATLRIQYCYLHDNNGGEGIKSRSRRNEIYYNWLQQAPGTYNFYQMSLYGPETPVVAGIREDGDVIGNVFVGVAGSGSASSVRLGSDGHSNSEGRYRFVNNTFVTFHTAPRDFLRVFQTIESIELINNVFYSANALQTLVNLGDASWTQGQVISGRNNWISNSVAALPAGLQGTLRGTNPGLTNYSSVSALDPRPVSGGAIVNQGHASLTDSNPYPIPNPLTPVSFMPPIRLSSEFTSLTPTARSISGTATDIGAFEFNSGTTPPPPPPPPPPSTSPCDVNGNGSTNVTDVQLCVNQAIALEVCTTGDVNNDTRCDVVDVQRVVNAALGGSCVTQ